MQNSEFRYHRIFIHGTPPAGGRLNSPQEVKYVGGNEVRLCGKCHEWIVVAGRGKKTTWYRHAYKVSYPKLHLPF